jgi:prevent-host-death family protein
MEALMRIGLREANQRFSKAVKAVKAGEEVVLTERGKPIAVLKPFPEPESGEAAIRRLEAAGLLRPAAKAGPMPPWRPRILRGAPISRTLRAERDTS